jgi:hypothetical protein
LARASARVSKMEIHFFGSSSCLVLLLLCTPTISVRETLHIWPPPPVIPTSEHYSTSGLDNVIIALEHNDHSPSWHISSFARRKTWCQPFPIHSWVDFHHVWKYSSLFGIPFPALPKLLLSTPVLFYIPDSGYTSPNTMLICLSALASLEELRIDFYSHETRLYCH